MVIDPNDATGTPGTQSNSTTFNYMYPIAPRAAYGTGPTATVASPWFGNATILRAGLDGLDLIDPNQVNNYWIVPPNTTSPNADGTAVSRTPIAAPGATDAVQRLDGREPAAQHGAVDSANRIAAAGRLEPGGNSPLRHHQVAEAGDNPWITVDYMDVPVNVMALKITGVASDFSVQLQGQLGGYYNSTARAAYQAAGTSYYPYSFNAAGATSPNVSTDGRSLCTTTISSTRSTRPPRIRQRPTARLSRRRPSCIREMAARHADAAHVYGDQLVAGEQLGAR